MSEKLQKVLARAGVGSRREIEGMIQAGRVSINGVVVKLGDRLEDTNSNIRVDGHSVQVTAASEVVCRVLAYNKPEGELCTRSDPEGRRTVFDRLPRMDGARWVAIGRLDANTSGLMLFTTDGELANRLMHPSRQVEREYMVRVFGEVNEQMIKNMVRGVELEDGTARFEDIIYAGGEGMNHTFFVMITEGRNREVRRLWESQGVTVSRLKRVRYGNLYLNKELPRGGWMELELEDVNYLRELVELRPERETIISPDMRKRKARSQKIRRAVRRHEDRVESGPRRGGPASGAASNPSQSRSDQGRSGRPSQGKPEANQSRSDQGRSGRPSQGKPEANQSRSDQGRSGRPSQGKPDTNQPRSGKPRTGKPGSGKLADNGNVGGGRPSGTGRVHKRPQSSSRQNIPSKPNSR